MGLSSQGQGIGQAKIFNISELEYLMYSGRDHIMGSLMFAFRGDFAEGYAYISPLIDIKCTICQRCINRSSLPAGLGARGEHGERGEDGKHGDVLRFSTEVFSGSPT